jgi:hypothetical protein
MIEGARGMMISDGVCIMTCEPCIRPDENCYVCWLWVEYKVDDATRYAIWLDGDDL